MVLRTIDGKSTYVFVVISPEIMARPVVTSVSHATRPSGSSARTASRIESEIWSAILSGCPSVTDSEVNRVLGSAIVNAPRCWGTKSVHLSGRAEHGQRIEAVSGSLFAPLNA